jgi:hypothetical protein
VAKQAKGISPSLALALALMYTCICVSLSRNSGSSVIDSACLSDSQNAGAGASALNYVIVSHLPAFCLRRRRLLIDDCVWPAADADADEMPLALGANDAL